jgi:tetratricopeptide (TPR) repeat protein
MVSWIRRRLPPALFAMLLFPSQLPGQSAADRSALLHFGDTLAAATSADQVAALEAAKVPGTTGLLRSGLAALRRGEFGTDRGPYDAAIQRIERAIDDEGKWPYPWFALGLAQLGAYRQAFLVKASNYMPQGASYREAAMRSLARAIEKDSTFTPAADALAGITLSLGHRLLPKFLAESFQRVEMVPTIAPEVSLASAYVAFGNREYQRTLNVLGDYLRRGGDSGVARVEQSRTLMALGRRDEAVAAYLGGTRSVGGSGRLAYRDDLAWIAGDDELRAFDSLPVSALPAWIERFWRERDALNLRAPNERLAEHLRRWVYVHENFLTHRPDDVPANAEGFGPQDQASLFEVGAVAEVMTEVAGGIPVFRTYRRTQWELDDRGVMYLRHGEPTKKVSSAAGPPNESWAYDLPEGRRVFHFIGSRALGTQAATTLTASLPLDPDMLDARADLDARYAVLASKIQLLEAKARTESQSNRMVERELLLTAQEPGPGQTNAQNTYQTAMQGINNRTVARLGADVLWREVARNRTAIAAAVATDGYPLHYKESLDAIVQVYGVGFGQGEAQRILAVFAVPGAKLVPRARPDRGPGVLYPIAFRLIALDRTTGITRQMDTTRTFLARDTLRGDQHLTGLLELPVPPGFYQVRALVGQPGAEAGTGVGRDSVNIPASPTSMVLSDLILGRSESGLAWPYAGEKVPLNPLNAFPKGSDAELFYEIGGLTTGAAYQIVTAVRKADDKPTAKPQVQVGFEITAGAEYERVHRSLGLGGLKPGAYVLIVTVAEAGSGQVARRERALNILPK